MTEIEALKLCDKCRKCGSSPTIRYNRQACYYGISCRNCSDVVENDELVVAVTNWNIYQRDERLD